MKKLALTLLCAFGLLPAVTVTAQDAVLFHVTANNVLNLRACPGTDCERVGQVAGGTELAVHAIRDAWYQVLVDGELVWLAGWLTTQVPAADPTPTGARLLEMGETLFDSVTGCNLLVGRVAGEAGDLALLLAGEGRQEVRVDVYPPGAAAALPLAESSESLADVMGNPVIIRTWPEFPLWPAGRYRFELGLGESGNAFEWEMPGPGEYSLLIDCEAPASTAAPAQMLVTGEITRDRETGCNLYMTAGEGEAVLDILLIGEGRREARVDLFLPGDDTALRPMVEQEVDEPDEGEAYAAHLYSRDADWRPGLYRFELELGKHSGVFGWEMKRLGKYALLVDCDDGSSSGAPVRGDAPPQLFLTGEIYRDRGETGCRLSMTAGEGEAGIEVVFIGEGRHEARVDLFLPDENMALQAEPDRKYGQFEDGVAYIAQLYAGDVNWRTGLYRIELSVGERSSAFVWHMERLDSYFLFVDCDTPSSGASGAGQEPVMLEPEEIYRDLVTGCTVFLLPDSPDEDLNLLIDGERHAEVVARVYRPDASRPITVDGRLDRVHADSGKPCFLQYYSAERDWPAGLYRLELELEGEVSEFAWHMEAPRDQTLHARCDQAPPDGEAARATADSIPVRTLEIGQTLHNAQTGCVVRLAPDSPGEDMDVLLYGERRAEVEVRVYRPGADEPLPFTGRQNRTLPADEPFILQNYSADQDWPTGLYRLELELDGRVSAYAWQTETPTDQFIVILCDGPGSTTDSAAGATTPTRAPATESIERDAPLFQVVTDNVLNLRACGNTDCARVGQVPGGTELPVFAVEGDWYEVLVNGEMVWAAGWLTTRAPDMVLEDTSMTLDEATGCVLLLGGRELFDVLHIMVGGDLYEDVHFEFYLPGENAPLGYSDRSIVAPDDADGVMIEHVYQGVQVVAGSPYRLLIEVGGASSLLEWYPGESGGTAIFVICNDPESFGSGSGQGRVSSGATPVAQVATPVPARGSTPTGAPDDVLRGRTIYLDYVTNCVVYPGVEGLYDDLTVLLGGDLLDELRFALYAPGESSPLAASGQSTIEVPEAGAMTRLEYRGVGVEAGRPWRLQLELSDRDRLLEWYPEDAGETGIFIICDPLEYPASDTEAGPVSSLATVVAQAGAQESSDGATPAPPRLLQTDQNWLDGNTGCEILVTDRRLDGDLNVWITSIRPEDVEVRIYRPGDSSPLPFSGRFRDENEDTGYPFDWQYYETDDSWQEGTWQLEIRLEGKTSRFAWQLENAGDQIISILCDAVGFTLALTAEAADSREDGDASPSGREAAPVTPAPARVLEIGDTHRDPQSGCLVRLAPESPGQDLDVVLSGARRADVEVRVYRPGADVPLPITDRVDRVLVEGEPPVIQQNYSADQDWPWGLYRLEVELDGQVGVYGWRMEVPTDQFFLILCEEARAAAPLAAAPMPTPTPPRVLETEVFYRDERTGCDIIVNEEGLDGDLNLVLAGDRYEDIEARVYRPGSDLPLNYSDRLDDTFAESDEAFIWQYYTVTTPWSEGLYRLEIELDGRVLQVLWQLERGGDQIIHIYCSTPENQLPVASLTPTPTPTATVTPSPTATATPPPTRTPVPTRTRELRTGRDLRDFHTGCIVQVSPEGLDGHFHLVLTGDRREEVEASVYGPGESIPIDYTWRRHETFDDADERFVWLMYRNFSGWAPGLYRLELLLDGRSSDLFWNLEGGGDQVIYIDCDGPVPRPTSTPRVTPTPSPTLTPVPTPIPTPTPVEPEADIRTGALYLDEATGCSALVLELPPEQADWKDLWINRGGAERHDFEVDVWLPGAEAPLLVDEEYEERLGADELMVVQRYSPRTDWRNGLYRIDLRLNDVASSLTWRMDGPGYYPIQVNCGRASGPAPSV